MIEKTTNFSGKVSSNSGRGTYTAVRFAFRDGRQRRVRYDNMQDIEYYPADGAKNGVNTEALVIETYDRKIIIKGYNLELVFKSLDDRTLDSICETTERHIQPQRREGKPVFVAIDIQPLLFSDPFDTPDLSHLLGQEYAIDQTAPRTSQEIYATH